MAENGAMERRKSKPLQKKYPKVIAVTSGKGGGLSDMFGGGVGASAAGSTVMEKNLDRITVVAALTFTFTTLSLAMLL